MCAAPPPTAEPMRCCMVCETWLLAAEDFECGEVFEDWIMPLTKDVEVEYRHSLPLEE